MEVIAAAIAAPVISAVGYIYVCQSLKSDGTGLRDAVRPSIKKAAYLIAALGAEVMLAVLFNALYDVSLLKELRLLTLVGILAPAAAIDYKTQRIPNRLLIAAAAIRGVLFAAEFVVYGADALEILKDAAAGAAAIGGFFLIMSLLFKNSVGMGDVKLFAVIGLYQGLWGGINSVFFSLCASFAAAILLLITKKKGRKDYMPFAPAIFAGTVAAMAMSGM